MTEQQFSELILKATGGRVQPQPSIAKPAVSTYFDTLQMLFKLLNTVSEIDERLLMSGWHHTPGSSIFIIKVIHLPDVPAHIKDCYIKADWGILANVPDDTTFYWELDN